MTEKNITCTVCPRGCLISVSAEGDEIVSVRGNSCPRGEKYARAEFICPVRTLTSSVRIKGSFEPLLPVRTAVPIPKADHFRCMEIIRRAVFNAPIEDHQVLIRNIADTGADLVACTERKLK